jgi:PKD repeat protein
MDDGAYNVCLTVTDDDDSTDTVCHEVTVQDLEPTAAFTWSSESQAEGSPVQFTDQSESCPDEIAGWAWEFGGFDVSNTQSPVYAFPDNGVLSVCLMVTDDDNSADTACQDVTVDNAPPVITSLSGPIDPVNINDQPVAVQVTFSDPGTADTHDVAWDWGDLTSDTQTNATSPASANHIYDEPGVYTVQVTVTDHDGGAATGVYEFIVIYNPEGGFAAGAGWIDSPEGACLYAACTYETTGKAHFGFASKYKKGQLCRRAIPGLSSRQLTLTSSLTPTSGWW